jgi:Asp-tRNA(Asn)/Glu-tRNA(Gln) amidotransferase A subunit family amidase
MTQPCDLEAVAALSMLQNKSLSPVELMQSCLDQIDRVNAAVNAVVALDADAALQQARRDEKAIMAGEDIGLLGGLPVGIKDLEETAGLRTTHGSLLYKDHVPDTDDDMVASVRRHGGNIFCKTNTPEFGAGANTVNRVYGATGNPFDPIKTCAGSSGGTAVALATNMLPLASGSDYGGSLRNPASFCGITGFRPSPGVVPATHAEISLSPFSVLGPMGRTVADTHLLLRAQIWVDRADPFSAPGAHPIPETLQPVDLSTLKVAWSEDLGCAPIDNNIRAIFRERIGTFGSSFGEFYERAPDMQHVHETFEVLRGVSFVASHARRLAEHRDLLGPNIIDNTERGLQFSAADIARASAQQATIYRDALRFFSSTDIVITPATAVTPFPHSQLSVGEINGETLPTYMRWLAIAYAPTTAMCCACVLPCGVDHKGMPFGLQIVGPNGSDANVLAIAKTLESVLADNPATRRPIPDIESLAGAPALAANL